MPRSLSLREYLSSSGAILFVIPLAVFAMFSQTVIVAYAFSDDYPILSMAAGQGPSPWLGKSVLDAAAVNGRPFAGLLNEFFFSAAGTIDNLRFVRLVSVVGIAALALLMHWALVRSGVKRVPAALIAVLVCSLPAFQVYSSWTVLVIAPFAALLGGGASLLAVAATDGSRNLVMDRLVAATAMLLAALLIYQPPAMFFWVFLAIALVGAVHESRRATRLVLVHLGVASVALLLAFLVLKLGVRTVGETAPNAGRNALTNDIDGKIRWFFEVPLYRTLNLFDLTPSLWFAGLVAVIGAGGIALWLVRRGTRPVLYLLTAVMLIPLSFLPNLVVAENSPTYRVQVSLSALVALYACLGALGFWLIARDWLRPRVSNRVRRSAEGLALALSVAFVATSAFIASKNVTALFVEPQSTELRMIRGQVASFPTGISRVVFMQTGRDQGMSSFVSVDEFGVPSSAQPWSHEPLVLLILDEQGRLAPDAPHPIVEVLPPYASPPTDKAVVDVRGLMRLR